MALGLEKCKQTLSSSSRIVWLSQSDNVIELRFDLDCLYFGLVTLKSDILKLFTKY